MIVTLIHLSTPNAWHVLRQAHPGGRITTLCCDAIDYVAICIATIDLADHDSKLPRNTCPACRTELAARTPGAAEAIAPSRAVTVDIRNGHDEPEDDWGPDSAAIASALDDDHEDLLDVPVEATP